MASISFSLDGASKETYDSIRRREGAFDRTVDAIRKVVDIALKIQVNTAVMGNNFLELNLSTHQGFGRKNLGAFLSHQGRKRD